MKQSVDWKPSGKPSNDKSSPKPDRTLFTQRLARQRNVSPHTIASYRDTFKLFLKFAHRRTGRHPSDLQLEDFDAELVVAFLDELDLERHASPATLNLRLTAIRCFFRFLAFEEPAYSGQIQRVLAIPGKIGAKREVQFLTRTEIDAILAAPDRKTWLGRRDHLLLLTAVQTGMRLSELVGLDRAAITVGVAGYIRCFGKGRKERCTPITKVLNAALTRWLDEPPIANGMVLFPTIHGGRMSPDAVQYLLAKYVLAASKTCISLRAKRISPHILRHRRRWHCSMWASIARLSPCGSGTNPPSRHSHIYTRIWLSRRPRSRRSSLSMIVHQVGSGPETICSPSWTGFDLYWSLTSRRLPRC